jgi:hypothetical protein
MALILRKTYVAPLNKVDLQTNQAKISFLPQIKIKLDKLIVALI